MKIVDLKHYIKYNLEVETIFVIVFVVVSMFLQPQRASSSLIDS